MRDGFLAQAVVYLAAAAIAVPIAKRLGLGSVLGYLLAGILIGPFGIGLVGDEGHDVMHFAEFGVVMMLFLVGLELRPSLLWKMRGPILGLGGAQVLLTTLVVAGVCAAFGLDVRGAIAIGMIASSSSTAIVLQSLSEKALIKSEGGQASFAVLLFQDIAVIPMLALMPFLASSPSAHAAAAEGARPAWQSGLFVLGALLAIVVAGRYLLRPVFRFLAATRLREVLTAAALLLVLGTALLMERVGLSPALGTFLAGVLLAESEYRHQLEADVEPFKGLFLGVFFIAVGASVDFTLILAQPGKIAAATIGVVALKATLLFALGRIGKLTAAGGFVFAFALAQVGEFAFVLVSFAQQVGVLRGTVPGALVAVTALSMLATPLLLIALERGILPRLASPALPTQEADAIDEHEPAVVMAGFGRFGQIAGRLLRHNGFEVTVLDVDPEIIDVVRRLGSQVYYGDASRLDLLHAAGCARAKLFLLAIDDKEKSLQIAHTVREHFPHLQIIARAVDRVHFYKLRGAGVRYVVRETFGSALEMGELGLRELGRSAHNAHRAARLFKRHDDSAAERLAMLWGGMDQTAFFSEVRQALSGTEAMMRDEAKRHATVDEGWDNESLRDELEALAEQAKPES